MPNVQNSCSLVRNALDTPSRINILLRPLTNRWKAARMAAFRRQRQARIEGNPALAQQDAAV